MTPREFERARYGRLVADGNRKIAIWVEAQSREALERAAKKDRRSLRAQISVILEDWVKYHVEDEANP